MPETLHEAIRFFSEGDNALRVMIAKRWPNGVTCPHCETSNVLFMAKASKWQCRNCRKQFTVKVGTIFEDSPIKLDKWLSAMWMITGAKNGISSCELHRAIGVTQKTAWFMLHRIRLAMTQGTILRGKMSGTIEADETFIGGKSEFMHKERKAKRGITPGNGMVAKTAVIGFLQRPDKNQPVSQVFASVLPKMPAKKAAMTQIYQNVEVGTEIHTDASAIYGSVQQDFIHKVVDHAVCYVLDNVHTNGLENFWCLLKRSIKGTYVSVEPFHLHRYVGEQTLRFNQRKNEDGDLGRFQVVLGGMFGQRLTYKVLTGKLAMSAEGKELLP